jgi:PPK2 family polyphosphate:nucleotide phosphotransferase
MALVDQGPSGSERHRIARLIAPLRVEPGSKVKLPHDFDPGYTGEYARKRDADRDLARGIAELAAYQDRLAAQRTHAVLLVLQALDAAGKDGTVKHVMSGVNPQGVSVHSFGPPSAEELRHDFLWRYLTRVPARGTIGIFNRSHYEEVLVVRVHPEHLDRQGLPPEARSRHLWERRFRAINEWERSLVENGVHIVKLFLNLSREEQRRRFLDRIETPQKNWKFSSADARERVFWDDYQRVYGEMLSRTSTEWAPWHVIPADHKWFARMAAAGALLHELMRIDPRYPEVAEAELAELRTARAELDREAG